MEKLTIEQEVMTIERLKELRSEMIKDLDPEREIFNQARQKWDDYCAIFERKFLIQLNIYFDQVLIDKNGETVRLGDVLKFGKCQYEVVDRSLQIVFGEIFNNPRITVLKYIGGSVNPKGRKIDIWASLLTEYEIVKDL